MEPTATLSRGRMEWQAEGEEEIELEVEKKIKVQVWGGGIREEISKPTENDGWNLGILTEQTEEDRHRLPNISKMYRLWWPPGRRAGRR